MASFKKRGDRWQACVKMQGHRRYKSFATKAAAVAWARLEESDIEAGGAGLIPNKTFSDLLERYAREVSPTKRGFFREEKAIRRLLLDKTLAAVPLRELAPGHFAGWRDRRLLEVSAATVNREMNIISHACTVARREWRWLRESPTTDVRRPPETPARKRRPAAWEIEALMVAGGYSRDEPPTSKSARTVAAFLLAIETGMRKGEITRLTRDHVFPGHVHLPITKNGTSREVPLSTEARRLVDQVMAVTEGQASVFAVEDASVDALFRKIRGRAGIEGLHFHDARHEAITRLSRVYGVMALAEIAGIRDLKILQAVYYNPTIEELAAMLP